jgi:flagellar hook-basal body complex protein FliE
VADGIYGIGRVGLGGPVGSGRGTGASDPSFAAALRQAVERVSEMEAEAASELRRLLSGESEDLHKTVLAIQRSELAFEMLMQVRNKVVQAYQEIMRMQV